MKTFEQGPYICNPLFNIRQELGEIAEGTHFWCRACVSAHPGGEQSPDPRYCQSCYDILKDEASLLPPTKRPAWIPKDGIEKTRPKGLYKVSGVGGSIVLTLNGEKNKVNTIISVTPENKRGPKHRNDLPLEVIKQLASQGLGYKAISTRLKDDYGLNVSFMTIQRRLAGQGVLL